MSDGKNRCILALESSCDETAAAVLKDGEMKSISSPHKLKSIKSLEAYIRNWLAVFIFKMLRQLSSWL